MTDEELTLGERVRERRERATTRPLRRPGTSVPTSSSGGGGQKASAGSALPEAEGRKKKKNMRPAEMPINARPRPYVGRGERSAPGKKSMDPRFEEHCGKFNQGHFERAYGFAEDLRTAEKVCWSPGRGLAGNVTVVLNVPFSSAMMVCRTL